MHQSQVLPVILLSLSEDINQKNFLVTMLGKFIKKCGDLIHEEANGILRISIRQVLSIIGQSVISRVPFLRNFHRPNNLGPTNTNIPNVSPFYFINQLYGFFVTIIRSDE